MPLSPAEQFTLEFSLGAVSKNQILIKKCVDQFQFYANKTNDNHIRRKSNIVPGHESFAKRVPTPLVVSKSSHVSCNEQDDTVFQNMNLQFS